MHFRVISIQDFIYKNFKLTRDENIFGPFLGPRSHPPKKVLSFPKKVPYIFRINHIPSIKAKKQGVKQGKKQA